MKKLLLMAAGALLIAATAQADCGKCGADAVKDKAACSMQAGQDKAACEMKKCEGAKDQACAMKSKKCGPDCKKPCCAEKKGFFQKLKFWK